MTNELAGEKSPYLLQHAENPVEWYPWGDLAFSLAREQNRPILVSIGYSACHWCHVMAHESFEDAPIAALMNEHFVNIKVDREERPDVDAIYMGAVQALTGQGGWPLNVFLTPDGRPFFGGTYFPPTARGGMPGWPQIILGVAEAYRERPEEVLQNADVLTSYIMRAQEPRGSAALLTPELLRAALETAKREFDREWGGFGGAPKFPQPLALDLILRLAHRFGDDQARDFVPFTLRRMQAGGIFDQLGGGFHRYTVDGQWVVPHFEKMLYDNALLIRTYVHAFQVSGDPLFRSVVQATVGYLLRDLVAPQGAFFAAEDADSEGVEGKFYVWSPTELERVCGPAGARVACAYYGITPRGNFEGETILTQARSVAEVARELGESEEQVVRILDTAKEELLAARALRVRPGLDDKVLTGWNGLAIQALAEAGRALGEPRWVVAARRAADFILSELRPEGRLRRSWRDGPSEIDAFLEDYASLADGLISLYEATAELRYLSAAEELADEMIPAFIDPETGVFFDAPAGDELIVRPRSLFDNPIPSGNAAACFALLRLHALTGNERYQVSATPVLQANDDLLTRAPLAFPYLLSAVDFYVGGALQIALVGPESGARDVLQNTVFTRYLPNLALAAGQGDEPALLAGRHSPGGVPTAYVCRDFSCRLPVTIVAELEQQLEG